MFLLLMMFLPLLFVYSSGSSRERLDTIGSGVVSLSSRE
jgi:hypothetical protein